MTLHELLEYLELDKDVFETTDKKFINTDWLVLNLKLTHEEKENSLLWLTSYHGTYKDAISKIVKSRTLKAADNKEILIRDGHISGQYYYFTSPSLNYASCGMYSTPFYYNEDWWQVACEIKQKELTFSRYKDTMGIFYRNKLEWRSNIPNSTFIKSVLIRKFYPFNELSNCLREDRHCISYILTIPELGCCTWTQFLSNPPNIEISDINYIEATYQYSLDTLSCVSIYTKTQLKSLKYLTSPNKVSDHDNNKFDKDDIYLYSSRILDKEELEHKRRLMEEVKNMPEVPINKMAKIKRRLPIYEYNFETNQVYIKTQIHVAIICKVSSSIICARLKVKKDYMPFPIIYKDNLAWSKTLVPIKQMKNILNK